MPVNVIAPIEVREVMPLTPAAAAPILAKVIALPLAVREVSGVDAPVAPPIVTDPEPPVKVNR